MRPSEFEAVRPYLQRAVDDIDYYLTALDEWEKVEGKLCELYDSMVAGKTPPEVKGREKPVQLTEKQKKALAGLRPNCFQLITDEQAQAEALAELPGEPMSDEQWTGLQFALRGGWQESSRQAAVWLRKAEETVPADGIDVALSSLPEEPKEAADVPAYRDAMREASGKVKTILTACLAGEKDQESSADDANTLLSGKGVSLLDAALILTEEDRPLAREKKSAWQKIRTPKLPASIGNCPNHKQVKLFAPSAMADFVEEVEGKPLCTQCKLRQRLNGKAREPRQE